MLNKNPKKGYKLVIQIPCLNEQKTIAKVIKDIPKKIPGISKIKILVVDDGSTDNTAQIAQKFGAYVYKNKKNLGLARTFALALKKSLELGADIIVNTDGDNQYDQKEIAKLVRPIVLEKADIVIGNRQIKKLRHMPRSKKFGNIIGSFIIRALTGAKINDASSGFRAYSRRAAQSFELISSHTYTHETIIQAEFKGLTTTEIPITFKKRLYGKSRLIGGVLKHIRYSSVVILRSILMYKAFTYLLTTGFLIILAGLAGTMRFLYLFSIGQGSGHVQSLVISSILISIGFNTVLLGIIADLISTNRKIIESKT
jgi:glycosyltransferase involved in cell wall biosynthesis